MRYPNEGEELDLSYIYGSHLLNNIRGYRCPILKEIIKDIYFLEIETEQTCSSLKIISHSQEIVLHGYEVIGYMEHFRIKLDY